MQDIGFVQWIDYCLLYNDMIIRIIPIVCLFSIGKLTFLQNAFNLED